MKQLFLRAFACCILVPGVLALDTQVFYRAGMLPDLPRHVDKQKPVQVVLRVASGGTRDAFDGHENKTALFNAYGAFDLLRLGSNLNVSDLTGKTVTTQFWHPTTGHWRDLTTGVATGDGTVEVGGRFSTTDVSLDARAPIFYGLYAQACVPFSKLSLSEIKLTKKGATSVKGQDISRFINTSLPLIMTENGFKPLTNDVRRDLSIGDPVLSVGWEGSSARLASLVTDVAGHMQLGLSVPASASKDQSVVFDLSRGHNGHLGCIGRVALEATFYDCVTLGGEAGSSVFFPTHHDMRLKTDKAQNGWLLLKKARVKEDYGSLWDIGGYVAITKIVAGLRALVGYTFTRQEVTSYTVRDADYLKDYIAKQPPALRVSPDDFANSDARLRGWESHVVRAAIQVDTAEMLKTSFGGLVRVEYSVPVLGKYSWATDMVAGALGCSFALNF